MFSQLSRQFKPHTTNGHAPPSKKSRKHYLNCQSFFCPTLVSCPALGQIDPQIPLLVCRSVNFFKFHSCKHTPPGESFKDFSNFYYSNLIKNSLYTLKKKKKWKSLLSPSKRWKKKQFKSTEPNQLKKKNNKKNLKIYCIKYNGV